MNLNRLIVLLFMMLVSQPNIAIFAYEPYEEIVSKAELIVTGTIITKEYTESGNNVFTAYKLKIKEIIKGKSQSVEIKVIAAGGCYTSGICVTGSNDYEFDVDDQVFMMLSHDVEDADYYESVRASNTVSLITDEGVLYTNISDLEDSEYITYKRPYGERPVNLKQVKQILKSQK